MSSWEFPLGREVIERLIPQRPPILMVDSVDRLEGRALAASKLIPVEDPVFASHFPSQPIWPGCFTIEGLAQSCQLLAVLGRLESGGASPSRFGLLAAVDVRFVEPVRPGARLEYRVAELRRDGKIVRYQVDAHARGVVVARGALTVVEPT
jgi:3-hydroxyacyl-[acyl-carrier-protein] dehydratase